MMVKECITARRKGLKVVDGTKVISAASCDFIDWVAAHNLTSRTIMQGLRRDAALDKMVAHRILGL